MGQIDMKDRVLNIKSWNPCASHPFKSLIEAYIRDGGIDPDEVLTEEDFVLRYNFTSDPGISVFLTLYADPAERVYYHIEIAISRVQSETVELLNIFLSETASFMSPVESP